MFFIYIAIAMCIVLASYGAWLNSNVHHSEIKEIGGNVMRFAWAILAMLVFVIFYVHRVVNVCQ